MTNLRISLAQINPTIGDFDHNVALMRTAARRARDAGAHVVVFPELALSAYYPGDLLDEDHFIPRLVKGYLDMLAATRETPDLHWIVGLPLREPTGTNKRYSNAAQVILNGHVLQTYRKQLLPTYDVHDERRHFATGPDEACVVKIHGVHVGLMICEDGWNLDGQSYREDPWKRLKQANPDLVVSINASPTNRAKRERRLAVMQEAAKAHNLPLVYVNQVGGHDQVVYDGASFAVQADGHLALECDAFKEDLQTLDVVLSDNGGVLCAPGWQAPLRADPAAKDLGVMETFNQTILLGLKDYARRAIPGGFKGVIVGCSGGVDSALTLDLAAQALGPDKVFALTMPAPASSGGSVTDSIALCKNLGVTLKQVPITSVMQAFDATMLGSLGEISSGIARENLQPRIRATFLMTLSNMHGYLLLTTGNKSESMVGFCTLGGDALGGFNLIGDLYKTDVFALCEHRNGLAGYDRIPRAILDKPPSAELAEGQLDSQRLPDYPVLDAILKHTIEDGRMDPTEQAEVTQAMRSIPQAVIGEVHRLIAASEHKRRTSPPVVRVRARAIGAGRQMPIAAKHF